MVETPTGRVRLRFAQPNAFGVLDHTVLLPDGEEVFVPIHGTLTMLLGEPPERVDVEPGGVVVVHIATPMQARNETDEEITFFAFGAPPRHGNAQFLEDVETL